jgi:hypothetical protein
MLVSSGVKIYQIQTDQPSQGNLFLDLTEESRFGSRILRGYLIFRSGYLPRVLGGIVLVGGTGFVVKNLVAVLVPQYDSMAFVLPMFVAMVSMAFWFLVKGIDQARWEQLAVVPREEVR